jgi:Ca2+-binding RTX toxin-like protein
VPSSASAAVSCNLAAGVLTVNVTGAGTQTAGLRMENGGTEIAVYDTTDFSSGQQNCGTTPTQANTNTIAVADTEPGTTNRTQLKVSLAGGPFVNTDATGEGAGTKEIEITYDGGEEATDDLLLDGAPSPGNDNWRMGELLAGHGFQLDDSESGTIDVDDLVASNVEQLQVGINVNPGDDTLDARGGSGFTGPMTFASVKQLVGGSGNDQIFAGDGNGWLIEGDGGADQLIGGPGNDQIRVGVGTDPDTADGNGGTDSCSYLNHNFPVRVDLRVTAPQDTGGAGIDTLSDCEDLSGGAQSDLLIGTNGPNFLSGGETSAAQTGADTLIGLGGNDNIFGSFGSDTASYAQGSTGPVTVDLGNAGAQNTGGAGTDTITNTENLVGSQFSDTLTGDGGANQIDVYDGILDTANCGGGADTAIADEVGIDSLTNCETVDTAPRVSVGAPPADGAVLNDPTPAYPLNADESANFQVSVDGAGFVSCAASCEPPPLADGPHTLTFRAVDADENLHPGLNPVSRSVTINTAATPDSDPPETKVKKLKIKGDDVTLKFSSDEPGSTFRCKLDKKKLKPCRSPKKYKNLDRGKHKFTVVATDAAGNVDPSPAKRKFKIE